MHNDLLKFPLLAGTHITHLPAHVTGHQDGPLSKWNLNVKPTVTRIEDGYEDEDDHSWSFNSLNDGEREGDHQIDELARTARTLRRATF